jgi:hypothetical protein
MGHKDYFIRSAIDFAFRRQHSALALILVGAGLLTALLAGIAFSATIPLSNGDLRFSFSMEGGGAVVTWAALTVALLLIGSGLIWLYTDWRRADRRRVFAIEFRGLRDWNGTALVQAIPPAIEGQRVEILVDMRQGVADGFIVAPETAIDRLLSLRTILDQHEDGRDRADMTHVAGGLAPVPLSFLGGVLLDDEAAITFFDWHRDTRLWNELNGADDGERFTVEGLEDVAAGSAEVIVTISASYRVDEPAAVERVGTLPIVRLSLPTTNTGNHWSGDKQQALARQFLDAIGELKSRGVRQVHLFFAGANSLVLRFGSVYDKRNLPALNVYQYESTSFTWGVTMPVAGVSRPNVVYPPA